MNVIGMHRCIIQERLAKVREVSVRMPCRGDPLIHLKYMDALPQDIFLRESSKHQPWRSAAANCHQKAAACCGCCTSVGRDDRSRLLGNGVRTVENVNGH